MFDIPVGKALAVIQKNKVPYGRENCGGCIFEFQPTFCDNYCCASGERRDGKSVIFKLVDFPGEKSRFESIKKRAEALGVLGIEVDGNKSADTIECLERTLDIIEKNKEILDRNAGENNENPANS